MKSKQGEKMGGEVQLLLGDNLQILKTFEDSSIDSICTDPPY
jgi:predicted methyltransferase